ncbi:hypothetical protein IWX90DRAFT_313588 [Phyllosticta citrichinensis]|uniref:Uncharacterized protein n=1 Tax=Phyllosticta citrichinensis TaxID=1130410 RepID=A0ABR1XM91_9PEZI
MQIKALLHTHMPLQDPSFAPRIEICCSPGFGLGALLLKAAVDTAKKVLVRGDNISSEGRHEEKERVRKNLLGVSKSEDIQAHACVREGEPSPVLTASPSRQRCSWLPGLVSSIEVWHLKPAGGQRRQEGNAPAEHSSRVPQPLTTSISPLRASLPNPRHTSAAAHAPKKKIDSDKLRMLQRRAPSHPKLFDKCQQNSHQRPSSAPLRLSSERS